MQRINPNQLVVTTLKYCNIISFQILEYNIWFGKYSHLSLINFIKIIIFTIYDLFNIFIWLTGWWVQSLFLSPVLLFCLRCLLYHRFSCSVLVVHQNSRKTATYLKGRQFSRYRIQCLEFYEKNTMHRILWIKYNAFCKNRLTAIAARRNRAIFSPLSIGQNVHFHMHQKR